MGLKHVIVFAALANSTLFPQATPTPGSNVQPLWQEIDQFCGQLELASPSKRQIVVNGKSQLTLNTVYMERASMTLFAVASPEDRCCGATPVASAQSRRYGAFELEGVNSGKYWLRVQKDDLTYLIPVRVTQRFDQKICRDPSVGRSIVVDSRPPKIQIRIR
jgi:hypothetical protein